MSTKLVLFLILAFLGSMVYLFIDPSSSQLFPRCPFLSLTGFQCPGCGSQRALHQLLNGNISRAFAFNPLLVSLLPYVFIASIFEFTAMKKQYPKVQKLLFGYRTIYLLFGMIIIFWIGRNL